jgi:hypothetical protein
MIERDGNLGWGRFSVIREKGGRLVANKNMGMKLVNEKRCNGELSTDTWVTGKHGRSELLLDAYSCIILYAIGNSS